MAWQIERHRLGSVVRELVDRRFPAPSAEHTAMHQKNLWRHLAPFRPSSWALLFVPGGSGMDANVYCQLSKRDPGNM